jgi:dTDP-4-amino-4,6-dideoxygalactose transaminase
VADRSMIAYNIPALTGHEQDYLQQAIQNRRFSGDGPLTRQCEKQLETMLGTAKVLLTPSCTAALEMAAMLLNLVPGDEVIMPSFTFVSTANAFALRGAKIVFVDIDPRTMNIDPSCVRAAITPHTKAIVPVHYAGVGCDMDALMDIARESGVAVVEDAAQGLMASYRGRPLGTIGDLGCLSFHETKNIHCGEGGALIVNRPELRQRAEILREKGTNRARFLRGEIDKYTWVDVGSSYLPGELSAAFLKAQLEGADEITAKRLKIWHRYATGLANSGFELPDVPSDCAHNAHIFWVKARDADERDSLIASLRANAIQAPFHYVPLHPTPPGSKLGRFSGEDRFTSRDAGRLLRLPLHITLTEDEQERVIDSLLRFSGRSGPAD